MNYKVIELISYIVPLYGNKHNNPYGYIKIIGKRQKEIVIPFEVGRVVRGYYTKLKGSIYNPVIEVED